MMHLSRATLSFGLLCVLISTMGASCKTKRDVRREQEYERIKLDVREARGARADLEVISEEFRTELARLSASIEEQSQASRVNSEDTKKELAALNTRIGALEQQIASATAAPPPKVQRASTYDSAKGLFDEGKFEDAIEEAKSVIRAKPRTSPDVRKAQFLLGEAYFAAKDYGAAALEFSEFKKQYPKDSTVPNATLRQAQCFRALGKEREAKLFYTEILDKFPKSPAAGQAKKDLKQKH
jgi:tol-pal system protein YbgF